MAPFSNSLSSHGSAGDNAPFEADIAQSVRQLQAALTALFIALPNPVRGGADLQRELGIAGTLAWQLHGIATGTDPFAAATQVPGRHAAGRVLAIAAEKGLPKTIIEKVAAAFESFEACVERHAGDRPTLYSMLGGLTPELTAGTDMEARREAYRAMSHIEGIQRAASFHCYLVHPGQSGDHYDFVRVVGSVGFRIMRPFEKLCIASHKHIPATPITSTTPSSVRPVDDPGGHLTGVPLLKDFCTQPLAHFTAEPVGETDLKIHLSGQRVGRTGEMTFFFGEYQPDLVPVEEEMEFTVANRFPSAVQFLDVLLAPGVADRMMGSRYTPPHTTVYNARHNKINDANRLHTPDRSAFMGVGVDSLQAADAPRYVEILRFVCDKLGWNPDTFDAYRCRIEYPVQHSLLYVAFLRPVGGQA